MKVTITRWERETRIRVFGFLYHPEENNEKLLVTTFFFLPNSYRSICAKELTG